MNSLSETQISMIRGDIRANGIELRDLEDDLLDHICTTIETEFDVSLPFEKLYEKVKARVCPNGYKELQQETNLLIAQKFYKMKKFMNTSGIIGSLSLLAGSTFKILQYPGAGVMLGLGTLIVLLAYLPLMLIMALQQTDTGLGKLRNISGYIGANLIVAGIFLQIMHYADNRIFLAGLGIFLFLFIPLYLKASGKDALMKIQPATFSVLLIAIASSLFAFSIKMPSHAFYQGLAQVTTDTEESYELKYDRLLKLRGERNSLSGATDASLAQIEGLKNRLVKTTGFKTIDDVFHYKRATTFSEELDNIFKSREGEFNGAQLHANLTTFFSKLQEQKPELKSYIAPGADPDRWLSEHFYRRPLYSSYGQLTNMQLELVTLELEFLNSGVNNQ